MPPDNSFNKLTTSYLSPFLISPPWGHWFILYYNCLSLLSCVCFPHQNMSLCGGTSMSDSSFGFLTSSMVLAHTMGSESWWWLRSQVDTDSALTLTWWERDSFYLLISFYQRERLKMMLTCWHHLCNSLNHPFYQRDRTASRWRATLPM